MLWTAVHLHRTYFDFWTIVLVQIYMYYQLFNKHERTSQHRQNLFKKGPIFNSRSLSADWLSASFITSLANSNTSLYSLSLILLLFFEVKFCLFVQRGVQKFKNILILLNNILKKLNFFMHFN